MKPLKYAAVKFCTHTSAHDVAELSISFPGSGFFRLHEVKMLRGKEVIAIKYNGNRWSEKYQYYNTEILIVLFY